MQKNYNHLATLLLVIFALGFLISYPFHDSFLGGLISSACCAATIGGLADWFAVTAIFKKPMGISWPKKLFRTEIIPRNRERIFNDLVKMVQDELLSKDNIKRKIDSINSSDIIIEYLSIKESRDAILGLVTQAARNSLNKMNIDDIREILNYISIEGIRNIKLTNILSNLIKSFKDTKNEEIIINIFIDEIIRFIKSDDVNEIISVFLKGVIDEYENGMATRKLTNTFIMNFILKMNPSSMANIVQDRLISVLSDIKDNSNSNRIKLLNIIYDFEYKLDNDSETQNKIETWKNNNFEYVEEFINGILGRTFSNTNIIDRGNEFYEELKDYIEASVNSLSNNIVYKKRLDMFIKSSLINIVEKKHSEIGDIVKNKLDQYSNDELVKLIEGTVSNDLQLIRINGSVVGGFVGIVTYLITYIIGR